MSSIVIKCPGAYIVITLQLKKDVWLFRLWRKTPTIYARALDGKTSVKILPKSLEKCSGSCAQKRILLYLKITKGHNSIKNVWIAKHWQYASRHVMAKPLWKFGQIPLTNLRGVAHRSNFFTPPADIPQSTCNNQFLPSENLVKR